MKGIVPFLLIERVGRRCRYYPSTLVVDDRSSPYERTLHRIFPPPLPSCKIRRQNFFFPNRDVEEIYSPVKTSSSPKERVKARHSSSSRVRYSSLPSKKGIRILSPLQKDSFEKDFA